MRGWLTRRDFLKGTLAALWVGLASCAGPRRLANITPFESRSEGGPSPHLPTLTERPTLHTEAALTPTPEITPTPELHEAMFYRQLDEERVQCRFCGYDIPEIW